MMSFEEIRNYWEGRAAGDNSKQSTTQDIFLREIELNALISRIAKYKPESIADIGSGDGRTTIGLARRFINTRFTGFDYSLAMIENSRKILTEESCTNLSFGQHDICHPIDGTFDLIYTTRCLINLPSWDLQKNAIRNIHNALKHGGMYLMIENFIEGQDNFNKVRKEYALPEIPIRSHNFFFARRDLLNYTENIFSIDDEINISSTYYLVSRVVYSRICAESGVEPDYFDAHHRYAANLPFCGEYGPVRLICFKKR